MKNIKRWLLRAWSVEAHIRCHVAVARWLFFRMPLMGKIASFAMDRMLMIVYGIDLMSSSIDVRALSISHPGGVLLGGNGLVSPGRVVIMAGVKLVAHSPTHPEYLLRHKTQRVFSFGDNVVIGANAVVIGPVEICDNVVVGAMALVNHNITEPGVYVGVPATKISSVVTDEWVGHLSN